MRDRFEREIEEILEQTTEPPTLKKPAPRGLGVFAALGRGLGAVFQRKSWRITPARVLFASVSLLLTALLVSSLAPGTGLVPLLGWAGLILFILAYALFFTRSGAALEKRWRGRPLEDRPSWRHRFRRWFPR